jgi:hypothetical protein
MMPPRLLRLDAGFACIEPSLFLKQNIPASGPAMFQKTATSSISRSRRCSTKRWSASWPGGSGSLAAARSCLAACLRVGLRRQSVALAQSGRLRDVP